MVDGNVTVIQGSSCIPPSLGVMNGMGAAFIGKGIVIMTLCEKWKITLKTPKLSTKEYSNSFQLWEYEVIAQIFVCGR